MKFNFTILKYIKQTFIFLFTSSWIRWSLSDCLSLHPYYRIIHWWIPSNHIFSQWNLLLCLWIDFPVSLAFSLLWDHYSKDRFHISCSNISKNLLPTKEILLYQSFGCCFYHNVQISSSMCFHHRDPEFMKFDYSILPNYRKKEKKRNTLNTLPSFVPIFIFFIFFLFNFFSFLQKKNYLFWTKNLIFVWKV